MPTYDYECLKCRKKFEAFQSMKDSAFAICPEEKCQQKKWGKGKVQRMLGTGAGLIFKGSGFYITDYRSEGYKAAAKSESGSGETKSSEAKPAAADSGGSSTPAKTGESAPAPATPKSDSKPASTDAGKGPKKNN